MLSEEEIIRQLDIIKRQQDRCSSNVAIRNNACKNIEAIQGLLDLYNKEKEKNKLQEETLIEFVEEREKLLKTPVISKDKIRKRIEEIRKIFPNDVMFTREFLITELKGLLEE